MEYTDGKSMTADLNTAEQVDLTDMCITPLPAARDHTYLSGARGRFSKTDQILDHKMSLNKMFQIIPDTFSNHNGMKLEVNNNT